VLWKLFWTIVILKYVYFYNNFYDKSEPLSIENTNKKISDHSEDDTIALKDISSRYFIQDHPEMFWAKIISLENCFLLIIFECLIAPPFAEANKTIYYLITYFARSEFHKFGQFIFLQ